MKVIIEEVNNGYWVTINKIDGDTRYSFTSLEYLRMLEFLSKEISGRKVKIEEK